jgi:hypothetical protein
MKLNNKFDGSKIKITRIRENKDWYGNAVHFQYEGQTYRASIKEDQSIEDESGNYINYAHLQIADRFGNWGKDIAKKDNKDEILCPLKDFAKKAKAQYCRVHKKGLKRYKRSIPYKFYDNNAFADYLNSVFVV